MRIVAFGLVLVLGLSVSTAGAAGWLYITGWEVLGGTAAVKVYDGTQWHNGNYYVGSFAAELDGADIQGPLYCLDVFHSFSFGQSWQVTPYIVPPDPPDPPPYNTGEAVWVYHRYGTNLAPDEAYKAGAVQLALWEISHDQNWRQYYQVGNVNAWASTGYFKAGSASAGIRSYANVILADLYANYQESAAGTGTYYEPHPRPEMEIFGQGQVGGDPPASPVPEPSSIFLLSTGLIGGAAGLVRRRR